MFSHLFIKLLPLYLSIFLGYCAGKLLAISRDSIAKLLFFIFTPIVILSGLLQSHIDLNLLSLPLIVFLIGSLNCLFFYRIGSLIWKDSTKNLLALGAGTGNAGYFGLPVALALFPPQGEGIYILSILGLTVFENSLGYYIAARGKATPLESFKKLLRLPTLYAFLIGLAVNQTGWKIPETLMNFIIDMRGSYTVLGMMMIGMGLAGFSSFKFDFRFLSLAFLSKFFIWPLAALLVIYVDMVFFGHFSVDARQALLLISVVPIAANTVIFAVQLDAYPEKAASSVFFSTLFALFYVPLLISLYAEIA